MKTNFHGLFDSAVSIQTSKTFGRKQWWYTKLLSWHLPISTEKNRNSQESNQALPKCKSTALPIQQPLGEVKWSNGGIVTWTEPTKPNEQDVLKRFCSRENILNKDKF